MSLNEEYFIETGLHSHYKRKNTHGKTELTYTRKYTWWTEIKIKELRKEIEELKRNGTEKKT